MISDKELIEKADSGKGLTVEEIKRYQKLVPPQKRLYGKYGTLKRKYLEDTGLDWTIANLPEYLHSVDRQAEDMYNVLYDKLSKSEQYKRTGDYMTDIRRINAMKQVIEEEILTELVYVG